MNENTRPLYLIGFIFLIALGFQVFTNYIPSIIDTGKDKQEVKKFETFQDELKDKLQTALDKYIKTAEQQTAKATEEQSTSKNIVSKRTPKYFSNFINYKENKPKDATFSLDDYAERFSGKDPVKGLDSKTLVIKLINPKTNKEETAVFLLNNTYISLAKF